MAETQEQRPWRFYGREKEIGELRRLTVGRPERTFRLLKVRKRPNKSGAVYSLNAAEPVSGPMKS